MFNRIVKTDTSDFAATVSRIILGLVILPHGAQKLLGWYGGYGFTASMGYFTDQLGIPAVLALLAIVAESFGALGLILGFLSRIAAVGVGAVMAVASFYHLPNGFFMNWFGNQAGEGIEFHLLAIALAVAVVIRGSGALSVDALLNPAEEGRAAVRRVAVT